MLEGLLILGTRVIIVSFTSPSNLLDLKNDWMAWTTSERITGQAFLKKQAVNLSGLEVFLHPKKT